ncbi:MAG: DUF4235 domain-containing protein [Pseudonocardiales bacterium]|nr:DUF4235 domain-containing protein [Pseudonocardiales bacterium]
MSRSRGALIGVGGGVAAGATVTPSTLGSPVNATHRRATDQDHGRREVLVAAGVQGAVIGVVNAALDRGPAAGLGKLTGTWPDK